MNSMSLSACWSWKTSSNFKARQSYALQYLASLNSQLK